MIDVHRRQIYYSYSREPPLSGWVSLALDTGHWVHCDSRVRIQRLNLRSGQPLLLLGECHPAVNGDDVANLLARTDLTCLQRTLAKLGGRFHLIVGGVLYRDAGGLLGLFYDENNNFASSSLAIAAKDRELAQDYIRHGVGIDWFPGPVTPASGIRRLLPGECFSFSTWRPVWGGLQIAPPDGNPGEALAEALVAQISAAAKDAEELFVPLTAGLDSRTVLAATLAAGLRPKLFTMRYPGIDQSDITVPAAIASRLGLAHRVIAHRQASPASLAAVDSHTCGLSVDADRLFLASGMWGDLAPTGLVLRGGGFEFGRRFYDRYIDGEPPDDADAAAEYIHRNFPNAMLWRHQPTIRAGLHDWWLQAVKHPTPNLVWRDRFYLDQRIGCWLSDIEQLLDAAQVRCICPANSARVYGALDCSEPRERAEGHLQKVAIASTWPLLLDFPLNPRRRLPERIAKAVRHRCAGIILRTVAAIRH